MKGAVFSFTFSTEENVKDESIVPAAIFAHLKNMHIKKIDFIAPVYYPIYVVDINRRKFIYDPNLLIYSKLNYHKNPPTKEFISYLENNNVTSYIETLSEFRNFFKNFDIKKINIKGLISNDYKQLFEKYIKKIKIKDIKGI
ncbi:MAG: hypothetical protein J7J93_00955, partial [Candidatus Aenigmarchaeota archaeon]|nr:hypothetical protein [Candidatus Aenigmarchaeota archaeon]